MIRSSTWTYLFGFFLGGLGLFVGVPVAMTNMRFGVYMMIVGLFMALLTFGQAKLQADGHHHALRREEGYEWTVKRTKIVKKNKKKGKVKR